MEKEKVLDIEFKEVWDNKWAWKITKNNLDFKNTGGEIISEGVKIICSDKESLYLFDNWLVEWEILEDWSLVDPNKKSEIENFVKYINSTYGIQKRWRGKRSDKYFSIFGDSEISETTDNYFPEDQRRYEWGNYFETEEEAQKVKEELDKFWAKVRAGEIGGEE
ncbi:hypothetical protein [Fusobacterium polymorphum]|uniref:Uncharacterized protein n=1 Tax=Fusobacterium nucleatum subsp. polymorphum TaxID=76857 RepID=A0A2C6BPF3_FUSNP|nr:hypothetical protein [Fusobacterium polymorphum]PHI05725.1 hypothetical protein CBG54_00925 [Fusobacterium polymorphum]